jgi:tRNA pseudouridine38-40 synthase
LKRIALGIEYNGTHYKGWQKQSEYLSVQQCLEQALNQVANESIDTICAGRTDAGVHACGQIVHFDTNAMRRESAWLLGVNRYLPNDISVRWMQEVPNHFSARYSAISRRYRYIIDNSRTRPALDYDHTAWYYVPLDETLMHQAAQYLIGEHDFSSFRGPDCQSKTPFRRVDSCKVTREGHRIYIDIEANAFLHHMVRNIVGSLLEVGKKKREPEWLLHVLTQRDRTAAASMAKAEGLYLAKVNYPEEFKIP